MSIYTSNEHVSNLINNTAKFLYTYQHVTFQFIIQIYFQFLFYVVTLNLSLVEKVFQSGILW